MQKILERIFDPILRFLKEEAEKLTANMKLITSKLTSKYVIAMFSLLEDMVRMKPHFIGAFEDLYPASTVTNRNINSSIEHFLEIFIVIERAVILDLYFFEIVRLRIAEALKPCVLSKLLNI